MKKAKLERERDAALERISALERTAVPEVPEKIRELESRLASLIRARERLFEGTIRASEARAVLERLAAERAEEIERLSAANADERERFASERAEREDVVKRLESRVAKLEYDLEGAMLRLASSSAEYDRLSERATRAQEELDRRTSALANASEVVRSLSLAHRQATESLAWLELVRVRLQYDVAARVGAAESNVSRAALAASRLREDRTLLLETIALRERRIAVLETTIRAIATDMIRAAEAERAQYIALNHALLSSKIVKFRDVIRGLRARLFARVNRAPAKRRRSRSSEKKPRHLRSA